MHKSADRRDKGLKLTISDKGGLVSAGLVAVTEAVRPRDVYGNLLDVVQRDRQVIGALEQRVGERPHGLRF